MTEFPSRSAVTPIGLGKTSLETFRVITLAGTTISSGFCCWIGLRGPCKLTNLETPNCEIYVLKADRNWFLGRGVAVVKSRTIFESPISLKLMGTDHAQ